MGPREGAACDLLHSGQSELSMSCKVTRSLEVDIVVAGGGPAGVAAAVAAARTGARVLLVERYGFLGGNATAGLVGPFTANYFRDRLMIAGIFQEIVDRLKSRGASPGTLKCPYPPGTTFGTGGYITPFDPNALRVVFDELVCSAGVQLLFHSWVSDVHHDSDGRVDGLIVENKGGVYRLHANVVVDATGDGDVAAWAGAQYEVGDCGNRRVQPATLMVHLHDVDVDRVIEFVKAHPEEFAWKTLPIAAAGLAPGLRREHVAGSGFMSLIREAKAAGQLDLGRNRITFFSGVYEGQFILNATRVGDFDATDPEALTCAEMDARQQAISVVNFARRMIPGLADARIASLATHLGVRESRRIVGEYVLTADDVLRGRRFPDSIGCGAYGIDLHKTAPVSGKESLDDTWIELDDAYDFPYRCLVPRGLESLLVCGRPISTTHKAMASTRVMNQCMVTGQAAGVAAAIASMRALPIRDVPIHELQRNLVRQGSIVRCAEE
jgi:hypothetical protein